MNYELNNYYNEDCLPAMRTIPDKFFELAIVDPPYGIKISTKSYSSGGNYNPYAKGLSKWRRSGASNTSWALSDNFNDSSAPPKEYFEQLRRISKNQIIFGANHFIELIPNANSSCWVIWDKDTGDFSTADAELAWTSFKTAVKIFKYSWAGFRKGNAGQQVRITRFHATQKPVDLYLWLLNKYAKPGDKILDTHVGSASSIIAFKKLGFEYMGFELDKTIYQKSVKRIQEFDAQISML